MFQMIQMRRGRFFLKLTLQGEVCESPPALGVFGRRKQVLLPNLLRMLAEVGKKARIRALLVVIKRIDAGWAQIEEIQRGLSELRRTGKKIHIYLEQTSNQSYYLAAVANRLYMPPSASLDFVGLSIETLFYRNLLAYLGVEPELLNIGKYKSAAEVFQREGMSEPSRRMKDSILSDMQGRIKSTVAERRGVTVEQVQLWMDSGPFTAREALSEGLIDEISYEDEVEKKLESGSPRLVRLPASRIRTRDGFLKRLATPRRPQIAYIPAEGLITAGESRRRRGSVHMLGAVTLIELLREARRRKRVKAIVLRINSPGGSGLASDLIWREVRITNQEKPVIISMGDTTASGGYYIAMAGTKVLTNPSTVTGSIGVIGGKFNLGELLSKVGISVDTISKAAHADYASLARSFSADERLRVRTQLQDFYENLFLKKTAEGRQKTIEEMRFFAEGRVWTGNQAHQNALVDEIGGILAALEAARQAASIDKYRLVGYVQRRSLRDLLPGRMLEAFQYDRILALMPETLKIR
jgi:protease-4